MSSKKEESNVSSKSDVQSDPITDTLMSIRGDRSAAELGSAVGERLGKNIHPSKVYRTETGEYKVTEDYYRAACSVANVCLNASIDFLNPDTAKAAQVFRDTIRARWKDANNIQSFHRDVCIGLIPDSARKKMISQLPIDDVSKSELMMTGKNSFDLVTSAPDRLTLVTRLQDFLMLFRGGPYSVWSNRDVMLVLKRLRDLMNAGLQLQFAHESEDEITLFDDGFMSISVFISKKNSFAIRQSGFSRIQFSSHESEIRSCQLFFERITESAKLVSIEFVDELMEFANRLAAIEDAQQFFGSVMARFK